MAKILKELLDNDLLDEDTKNSIRQAWDENIAEIKENLAVDLREEFADRYENDKEQLIEAMDKMLTDSIKKEIEEFNEERKGLLESRVKYQTAIKSHSNTLNKVVAETLKKEIKELREDRKQHFNNFNKLENFVLKQLANEISEFHEDKKSLAEAKVKLVAEGRRKIQEAKTRFIQRGSNNIKKILGHALYKEMSQLREDIKSANKNNFGRKIFEAFNTEFMTSYLNEGTEVRKLNNVINKQQKKINFLSEAKNRKDIQNRKLENQAQRDQILTELLNPLAKDKKVIMKDLLENVQNKNLRSNFNKYLPAVLNETRKPQVRRSRRANSGYKIQKRATLTERTGNKVATRNYQNNDDSPKIIELDHLQKLAGIQ